MNSGFIGVIGTWFMILFLWIGWFDRYFENHWISKKHTLLLLIFYLTGMSWSLDLAGGISFAIVTFFLPLLISFFLWIRLEDKLRLQLMTASFLIGTSLFFMQLIIRLDPILMFVEEPYMMVLLLVPLIVLTTKPFIEQFILLTLSLSLNDLFFQYYLSEKLHFFHLGSAEYRDVWWLSLYALLIVKFFLKKAKSILLFRRKNAETTN